MTGQDAKRERFNQWSLLLLVFAISAVFLWMIRHFLITILMAGIISALAHPIYRRLEKWFGGRRLLASTLTLGLIIFVFLIPMGGLLGIVAAQAVKVGEFAIKWVEKPLSTPDYFSQLLESLPFIDTIAPYKKEILSKGGELVSQLSRFILDRLSTVGMGAVNMVINVFIFLYCMLFFLIDGKKLLAKILYYLPLEDQEEHLLLDRFTSVTRATLKGTLVIGVLQGGLAGLAFFVVGIKSAVFWGAIMAVLSIIPSVGSALVWLPASIILIVSGQWISGIGLAAFCGIVVGSLDNVLRPIMVGKDTQMHELMIFFATLGGIMIFGVVGIIIGPILAALFITVWEIYGHAFRNVLPEVGAISENKAPQEPSE